ncbi:hypothetical protein FNW02_00990 [Komarekiella sp. 'clone 1']|uniref:Uncharacterized protein n=1 Tax=Komarekiella delphini-convector SJRDD-AB1 TaxID=2593771 RepID=A0AA40ST29_9NOST|nr:hypothetical protein [Komarekiella delphini-convector]MBD6614482.1 hypothetical protein [Komarekiella delphini-convector SJRDD-AB1]
MLKLVPVTLIATVLSLALIDNPSATLAGTCASKCGSRPVQFIPGQRVRLEVVNTTSGLVKLEKLQGTTPIPLQPGQKLRLEQGDGTQPNVSLVFWDETGLPLQAIVSKPNFGTLRLEIRPGNSYPGDRSLYILNDGRVNVF